MDFALFIRNISDAIDEIVRWDQTTTLWINSFNDPAVDVLWMFMSDIMVWIPLYVVVAGVMIWQMGWKKGLIAIALLAAAFGVSDQMNNLIKYLVDRPRPCNDAYMIACGLHILEQGGGLSFPSGHANNSMTFAIASALCFRFALKNRPHKWVNVYGLGIVSWSVLMGISRVMVGRHFLIDVIAGSLLGIICGIIFSLIFNWLQKKVN